MNQLLLVLAFVLVAVLAYKLWKPFLRPPKADVPEDETRVYFFYTDWCGFSQKALPEWTKFEQSVPTGVKAIRVDCEADKAKCAQYEIDSYPTILFETSAGITDFHKRPTSAALHEVLASL